MHNVPVSGDTTSSRVPPPGVGKALVEMSLDNIARSRSPSTYLFDRQIRKMRWDTTLGTEDITSTAICLIGLHRYGPHGRQKIVGMDRTFESLIVRARSAGYAGALGLILWADAVWGFLGCDDTVTRLGIRLKDVRTMLSSLTTMEVAWLLSGLLHAGKRGGPESVLDLAGRCESELLSRYSEDGRLFWHASTGAGLRHRIRRRVANFADQIYSVHALAMSSILNGDGTAGSAVAVSCAERLCALQGSLGQWWWHYDPVKGEVRQYYPVYAVHQYGMAPMALTSVGLAGGCSFADRIRRGINWITDNELNSSLVDVKVGTVWRHVDYALSGPGRLARSLRTFSARHRVPIDHPQPLEVNYETRPYEWGWLLYAFALAAHTPPDGHVV